MSFISYLFTLYWVPELRFFHYWYGPEKSSIKNVNEFQILMETTRPSSSFYLDRQHSSSSPPPPTSPPLLTHYRKCKCFFCGIDFFTNEHCILKYKPQQLFILWVRISILIYCVWSTRVAMFFPMGILVLFSYNCIFST